MGLFSPRPDQLEEELSVLCFLGLSLLLILVGAMLVCLVQSLAGKT